jgi:hypothetical protein
MMGDLYKVSRRDFIFSAAAALLVSHLPSSQEPRKSPYENVNWERVLNKVIGDRNALIMGFGPDIKSYKVGSPEWCMEEALAQHGLLAEGARVHV